MADATIRTIDAALFAALRRINPGADQTNPGSNADAREPRIRYIGRWLGEPLRATTLNDAYRVAIQSQVDGRTPALLLGFDGEVVDPRPLMVATVSGDTEFIATASWSVLVVIRDTRNATTMTRGSAAGPDATLGFAEIVEIVEAALSNLMVEGLYNVSNVRYVETRPYLVVPNEIYAMLLRFTTRRRVADARSDGLDPTYEASLGAPLLTMQAYMNLYPPSLAGDFVADPATGLTGNPVQTADPLQPLGLDTSSGGAPPLPGILAWWAGNATNGARLVPVSTPSGGGLEAPVADATRSTLTPYPVPSDGSTVPLWRPILPQPPVGPWVVAQASALSQPRREVIASVSWVRFVTGDSLYASASEGLTAGQDMGGVDTDTSGPGTILPAPAILPTGGFPRTVAVILHGAASTGATQYVVGYGTQGGATALAEWDVVLLDTASGLVPAVSVGSAATNVSSGVLLNANPALVLASYDGTTARGGTNTVTIRVVPASGTGATVTGTRVLDTQAVRVSMGRAGTLSARVGAALVWPRVLSGSEVTALLAWASAAYGVSGS